MPLSDSFTTQEVNDAIADLKAFVDDTKRGGSFKTLERDLPRLAHILTKNKVLVGMLSELPKASLQYEQDGGFFIRDLDLPVEPKARLAKQTAILIGIGEGKENIWKFSDDYFGSGNGHRFWEEIFFPAIRDLMRFVLGLQRDFNERRKSSDMVQKQKISIPKNYELDLFLSHSSKDKQQAEALIRFLCTALAIPHDRARCTSVDGYKLSGGAKTASELRKEILSAKCFIGLLTSASLKSQFVLFELGARWGSDEHLVPILGGEVKARALRPPLSDLNALSCGSKSDMEQLVHELAKVLKKNVPLPTIYETRLSDLIRLKARK
jgi:hypothetical protein